LIDCKHTQVWTVFDHHYQVMTQAPLVQGSGLLDCNGEPFQVCTEVDEVAATGRVDTGGSFLKLGLTTQKGALEMAAKVLSPTNSCPVSQFMPARTT
jgi:hypothetical protein